MTDDTRIVMVTSGAMDPLHEGHVRYLQAAALLADRMAREANGLNDVERVCPWHAVTVHLLNSDAWLLRIKRRRPLLPQSARVEVVSALRVIDFVQVVGDDRDDVCDGLELVAREHVGKDRRFVFAKGGDRRADEIPESAWCREHGWEVVDGVGGRDKPRSSRDLAHALGLDGLS